MYRYGEKPADGIGTVDRHGVRHVGAREAREKFRALCDSELPCVVQRGRDTVAVIITCCTPLRDSAHGRARIMADMRKLAEAAIKSITENL